MITGGSSGIGLATARTFAQMGFHIAICGRNVAALSAAANEIEAIQTDRFRANATESQPSCLALAVDLNDVEQSKQFATDVISHFGFVDVLVNNAGTAPLNPFDAITSEEFESLVNLNVRSSFYLTQMVWQKMKPQGRGDRKGFGHGPAIVNVSSLSAIDPFPGFSIYGASKAWLDLLTHSLAQEGEPLGIRVYSVRPGAVETPLLRQLFPDFPPEQCVSPEEVAAAIWNCAWGADAIPSGSMITVERSIETPS